MPGPAEGFCNAPSYCSGNHGNRLVTLDVTAGTRGQGPSALGWRNICRILKAMGRKLQTEKDAASVDSVSTDDDDDDDEIVPDGGWGWAVCFGSFIVNFILDGSMFSFGVLLLELLDYFGEGKAKTAWVGSALLGMSMFMGPVISLLLERFTCRQLTIAGSLISATGFIVSIFSPNVTVLILTYGVLGGIGFSTSFIAAIIIVGLYFKRKRAIATGIATSGSGLGTFAYAYLTNYLLDLYDWKGTVLILGGILLNCAVCGALFRPLVTQRRWKKSVANLVETSPGKPEFTEETGKLLSNNNTKRDIFNGLKSSEKPSLLAWGSDNGALNQRRSHNNHFSSHRDISSAKPAFGHSQELFSGSLLKPMSRQDIFYSGSLARLPKHRDDDEDVGGDDNENSQESESSGGLQCCQEPKSVSRLATSCRLFKDKVFVLLLLCCVLWTVQSVPLTYIPDLAVSKGLPTAHAALLISVLGISNICGRLLSGVITDVFRIKSTVTYTCALLIASLVNFLLPWCNSFAELAVCSSIFGFCMATVVSLRTIVLADHLGIDRLTTSFGMVALFQGIAFMTNAPLAGLLYEKFGSYVMPFCFSGTMYLISGCLCLAVNCISNKSPIRKATDDIDIYIAASQCTVNSDNSAHGGEHAKSRDISKENGTCDILITPAST